MTENRPTGGEKTQNKPTERTSIHESKSKDQQNQKLVLWNDWRKGEKTHKFELEKIY